MIAERALKLTNKIDNYTSLKENKNQIVGLTSRRAELEETLEELKTAVAAARILVKDKLIPADQVPDQGALVESIKSLKNGFTKEVIFVLEKSNWDPYKTACQQWIEAITNTCQSSWAQHTDSFVPKRNEELLDILRRIPGLDCTVDKINDIYASIKTMIKKPPASEEELTEFKGQVTELKKLWESIGSDKIPEKVIEFLKASITEKGAKLDLLDDEVLGWIRENALKDIFCITVVD